MKVIKVMIDRQRPSEQCSPDAESKKFPIRIGAVSYLNAWPLVTGLKSLQPHVELVLDYPSRLADGLAEGRLDVALIPSVEAFSNPAYEVASNACVATHGPVMSVKLFSRVHPGEIRTLALDEGSRTSAALTKVMLDERFGVRPQLEKLPIQHSFQDTNADAILLIGDRGMAPLTEDFHTVWDLGEEWVRWTGLPFVFAMWVTRKGVDLGELGDRLNQARDEGLENIESIAQQGSEALSLPQETILTYLTKHLHFHLGPAERVGLQLFQDLAVKHQFASERKLSFRESALAPSAAVIS